MFPVHFRCRLCRHLERYQLVFYHRFFVSAAAPTQRKVRQTPGGADHHGRRSPAPSPPATRRSAILEAAIEKKSRGVEKKSIDDLVQPVVFKPSTSPDDEDVGKQLSGMLDKNTVRNVLNLFPKRPQIRKLCEENGLTDKLFSHAFMSFRKFCLEHSPLPPELHILFHDMAKGHGNVDDLYPYFMEHARGVYPHLQYMTEMKKLSDLREPQNWYQEARNIQRKVIFHAGPTNSGKTYQALERFMAAKTGIYLGPLKLLATEVYHKTNNAGIACDLITGEERIYTTSKEEPSGHVASTIEMLNTTTPYEVAIIDEIQMIRDLQRGWAWTRALLGLCADEVHLCGEFACIDLVEQLLFPIGEEVEVRHYKRMTPLTISDEALESFDKLQPGDCIVAFAKNDIYNISRQIERKGHEVAVIYGGLPPGTKLAQAKKFNDPADTCKIMVATDAIGMGLNLSIKRIIFWSLAKIQLMANGDKNVETLSVSQALQIAGRAGRYGSQYPTGVATTFRKEDIKLLKKLLSEKVPEIEKAGIYPTFDQIEMFAYYLPHATLSNLIDIFVSICAMDETKYFMCNMDDFKALADMIEHVSSMSLKDRYVFCLAPVNLNHPFVCTQFLKFTRKYASAEPLTFDWLASSIGWPFSKPQTLTDLIHLEGVFDVMEMYLWLGYRFADMFPDMSLVRDMQKEVDSIIKEGVMTITSLLRNNETASSSGVARVDPDYQEFARRRQTEEFYKNNNSISDDSSNAKSPMARRLVEQGILTPDMIRQLKDEFLAKVKKQNLDPTKSDGVGRKPKK